jgi:hypothetical protein
LAIAIKDKYLDGPVGEHHFKLKAAAGQQASCVGAAPGRPKRFGDGRLVDGPLGKGPLGKGRLSAGQIRQNNGDANYE